MVANGGFYRPDHCNDNAANFVSRVMTTEERAQAHVLIFTHARAKTPELYWRKCFLLHPRAAWEAGIAWSHHTVAELGGSIYDYDYRGEPGTPLSLYAQDMFAEGISRCICRVIPAEDYVRKYKPRDMIFGENYPHYLLSVLLENPKIE